MGLDGYIFALNINLLNVMKSTIFKINALLIVAFYSPVFAGNAKSDSLIVIDSITYIEEEQHAALDFSTEAYLPADFDAYAAPQNVQHISYIEQDSHVELGFDTATYLPETFNPYPFYFDIDTIEYLEDNDLLELDFNTAKYLPANFSPVLSK